MIEVQSHWQKAQVMKALLRNVAITASGLLCLISLGSFLGKYSSILELLSHFRLVYCLAFVPFILFLLFARRWRLFLIGLMVFSINLIPAVSLFFPQKNSTVAGEIAGHVRVLQINLWGDRNHDTRNTHAKVLSLIRRTSPDVIGFSEITPAWEQFFKVNLPDYKSQIVENRFGGIALFSRLETEALELCYFGNMHRPRIKGVLICNAVKIRFMLAHPLIPSIGSTSRNDEFTLWAQEAKSGDGPFFLFGDLNCSPWSPYFGKLLQEGDLQDSEQGFGPQPTWNAFLLLPFVPIDHCLTNSRIRTEERKICESVGSDHLPVFVQLGFCE